MSTLVKHWNSTSKDDKAQKQKELDKMYEQIKKAKKLI